MQKRANVLKESQADAAHILVNGNTIVVALNGKQIKSETANSVSSPDKQHHGSVLTAQ